MEEFTKKDKIMIAILFIIIGLLTLGIYLISYNYEF